MDNNILPFTIKKATKISIKKISLEEKISCLKLNTNTVKPSNMYKPISKIVSLANINE